MKAAVNPKKRLIKYIFYTLLLLTGFVGRAQHAQPLNLTADEDRQQMMEQLGIKALRPGASGDDKAPNHANYDETVANPYLELPEVLKRIRRLGGRTELLAT